MTSFSPDALIGDRTSRRDRQSRRHHLVKRLLLGGATIIASLVAYVSYTLTRDSLLESLKTQALQDVQQSGSQLNQWLISRKTEVQTLANTPTLRSMNWEQVGSFLKPELSRLSDFYTFSMVRPNGTLFTTQNGEDKERNLRDRQHFQRAISGETYVSNPVLARGRLSKGKTIVVISTPIYQNATSLDNSPIGVVDGIIDISRLTEVVQELSYGTGSYAFALNSNGLAIVHPDPTFMSTIDDEEPELLTHKSQGELSKIAQRMVARESDIQLIRHKGESVYVAFLPLEEADWSLALVIPRQNIESQLRLLDLMAVLLACVAFAVLGLLLRFHQLEQRRLQESKALSDSANQAKSEFLSNMSHELRTPLNAILGFGQLMQNDHSLAQGHRDSLTIINRSGKHLLSLINDVLSMSKIEAGRVSLNENEFSLFHFLDELRSMLKLKAQDKGLNLLLERSPDLPSHIFADEGKLRQILINLLNNALKFTESGYVKLHVTSLPSQSGDAPEDVVRLCFSVRDSGPGIAPNELKDLFVAFVQTETGRRSQIGTGLGLPISRTFARLMKGDITVTSELGQGSDFSCEIQAKRIKSVKCEPGKFDQIRGLAPGQTRYRMLIAEDDVYSRQLLFQLLESTGFEVEAVANGEEALARWRAWQPHMLWMDLRMPRMGGLEAVATIKAEAALQNGYEAPIMVAVTANAFELDRSRALAAGYDDFVAKPYAHRVIFEKIAMHLAVDYAYEKSEAVDFKKEAIGERFVLSAASFAVMPEPWRLALREAAQSLNDRLMEGLVEEIPAQHQNLKTALDELLQDFRYEVLVDLLQERRS